MTKKLLLPCMRGAIGDWVTYTCLMRLNDIAELVGYAGEIHKNKKLSKLIQRELINDRSKEIGEYLLQNDEAFFNSLVVAIYEGSPEWHQLDSIRGNTIGVNEFEISSYASECLGYLSLTRGEKIFALDGQHRLSGINYALKENPDVGYQQIPVTFLAHYNDEDGLRRTRRLFTTLNKKAKPVNKAAIISLDEDDICARTTRYLVEETNLFDNDKIKFQANNNISYSDTKNLTTIGNLYDLVFILFKNGLGYKKNILDNFRGDFEQEKELYGCAEKIFNNLFATIPELKAFQKNKNRVRVVEKYRNKENGGSFLYRPLGLKIYFLAMTKYAYKAGEEKTEFESKCLDFISGTSHFDFNLQSQNFEEVMWDSELKRILRLSADSRDEIIDDLISFFN
ncbi:DGQHR domain-containing protein [Pseudoalteromonas shioyasakiensis]|uniref:DGQHR domain-containing protein n=1 Tax=Pseudoalteromonas shioyasakiensis TaxID=1190813 RepID=UPI0020956ED2|nr:DNA sulfur modification protein DndB [Pseudoalteromonas shioyasakiensis]MCO6356273.1 DGQHR domain-containing protein [Pseudoalteromonas shioyasakiensis]